MQKTETPSEQAVVRAALLIIGDEILSGRTRDANTAYLGQALNERGIRLSEVRIVPDVKEEIVAAVLALKNRYDFLFTTGGIGPTHDDITAESVAEAFGVELWQHPDAYAVLLDYYGEEKLNSARLRMASVPKGAELISNPLTAAPGFSMENVFVLAGVPKIMQALFAELSPRLTGGDPVLSETVTLPVGEGLIAGLLGEIAEKFPDVSIGSYPSASDSGFAVRIVVRSSKGQELSACLHEIHHRITAQYKSL